MRVIDAGLGEVRAIAVSPDGRFVAASGRRGWYAVLDWATGETVRSLPLGTACEQFAFGPGGWLAYVHRDTLHIDHFDDDMLPPQLPGKFAGGLAVSPDGKTLVATQVRDKEYAKLTRWSLPASQPLTGFDFWEPFRRLAFTPNGQFLAGIWPHGFELRFAVTGGLDYRFRPHQLRGVTGPIGFLSFTRDSGTCAFGWDGEFHILDIATGTSRALRRVQARFRDAAFTGSGQRFATVGDDGRLKLWDPQTWEVVREYDWDCGPLTSLAFTADGSAGVCGTADGRLVQFDVDE